MNNEYYNRVSDYKLQKGGYYPQKVGFFENELQAYKNKSKGRKLLILDIACNEGTLSKVYSKYGKVMGVDLNKKGVLKAKRNGVDAVVGDVMELDRLFNYKFDVIVAGDIIEHLFDTDKFLQVINTVLKKDGVLLLSTPNIVSLGRRLMAVLGKNPYCEYCSKANSFNVGHIRYYSYQDIFDQLKENGFGDILIKSDTLNLPPWILDKLLCKVFPGLGRELLVRAKK